MIGDASSGADVRSGAGAGPAAEAAARARPKMARALGPQMAQMTQLDRTSH